MWPVKPSPRKNCRPCWRNAKLPMATPQSRFSKSPRRRPFWPSRALPPTYLILEVGLGGRLDATNVIAKPVLSVITTVDYDHQQYLGNTLTAIAHEKAGILKHGVPAIIGPQPDEARSEIERVAEKTGAPVFIANQDWQSFEQHGRLVFQDENGLLDLSLPQLKGRHQVDNAGNAIAAIRLLDDQRISELHIEHGLKSVVWPARMQRLGAGALTSLLPKDAELWLDGGHNPSAGRVIARAFSDINDRFSRPACSHLGHAQHKGRRRASSNPLPDWRSGS